jgi:hypothetical protein
MMKGRKIKEMGDSSIEMDRQNIEYINELYETAHYDSISQGGY